jgi:hypothetical protein
LIQQFEQKSASNAHNSSKKLPKSRVTKEKAKRRDSSPDDSEEDDEEAGDDAANDDSSSRRPERRLLKRKKKDKTKPSFLIQTSSGRTPKATTRYVADGGAAPGDGIEHKQKKATRAEEAAAAAVAAKRTKLAGKQGGEEDVAVTPQNNKIGVTIKKSPESDSSFESTILGLEEELKRLPAKRPVKEVRRRRRRKKTAAKEEEEEEEMPPKLEPNYPDLKVGCLYIKCFYRYWNIICYKGLIVIVVFAVSLASVLISVAGLG